ncbi:MAG: aminoacyl-tRNA hydrolase [Patescibacteria group bacterium]|jgi:PTH1 family peptidyl-tRNA hydrolase
MKLIIGLGNPGKDYLKTRHNTGFMALDALQANWHAPNFSLNKKFKAEISELETNGQKIILAKPQTFMNASGEAIQAIVAYFKIKPEDIWVIYDDVDLPLGKIRIGQFESAGGHNGLKSIIECLGVKNFIRFRIGIAENHPGKIELEKFVLQKFGFLEKNKIKQSLADTTNAAAMLLAEPMDKVMNKYN